MAHHAAIVVVLPKGTRQVDNPLMNALDPNHDHVISADEIQAAATALLKLDKNGDGELSEEEFRPDGPPPPPPPPRDRRIARWPRSARCGSRRCWSWSGRRRGRGERPPRDDGDRPGVKVHPIVDLDRRPVAQAVLMALEVLVAQAALTVIEAWRPGGPGGPPNPERFVEHALEFDANEDGMLDKSELLKFAEEMGRRRGGPGGGGGPGMRRPDGPRDGDRPGDNGDQPAS